MAKNPLIQSSIDLSKESDRVSRIAAREITAVARQIAGKISAIRGTALEGTVTDEILINLLKEVDLAFNSALRTVSLKLKQELVKAYRSQYESIIAEVKYLDRVGGIGLEPKHLEQIDTLKAKVNGRVITNSIKSTLEQLSSDVALTAKAQIRGILARGAITGEPVYKLASEIADLDIPTNIFRNKISRGKAIVRTEFTNLTNAARYESVGDVNRKLPKKSRFKYKWWALLDLRTSNRCRSLHGQVRAKGEKFVSNDGWSGYMPSAHPHCRSVVVPYSKRAAKVYEDIEARFRRDDKGKK